MTHHIQTYPWYYTLLSVTFFLVFFIQPLSWRRDIFLYFSHYLPQDNALFLVVSSVIIHTLVFVGTNILMAIIYWMQLPFFEQFKIQKNKPWPWLSSHKKERDEYWQLIRHSILLMIFNQYVLSPIFAYYGIDNFRKAGMSFSVATIPEWWLTLFHIGVCMVVEDTCFYWAHRTLHHPSIYGYVHKLHHRYKVSIGIASEYAHPVEFLLANVVPFTLGPLLCGMHIYSWWYWMILRIGETVDGHCGYSFPWSPYRLLPFSGSAQHHDFHHSHNVGNYSSFFTWWDAITGSDAAYKRHVAKLAEQPTDASHTNQAAYDHVDAAGSDDDSTSALSLNTPPALSTRSSAKKIKTCRLVACTTATTP